MDIWKITGEKRSSLNLTRTDVKLAKAGNLSPNSNNALFNAQNESNCISKHY